MCIGGRGGGGMARALLGELERVAVGRGITLLLMDTRQGGEAESAV